MKIVNNTGIDLKELENKISEFYPYSKKTLGFDRDPSSINLVSDPQNATNILGKTAFYNPGNSSITVYTDNRHPKDILRSISHELVHHTQNCRGEFSEIQELDQNYAQNNKKLREMEKEAYLMGNMTFRDWEDGMKKEINEEYADGPAVDDRRLGFKTAHKNKQWSNSSPSKLSTTAPSKDTRPRKDNKAQNAIRQFGKIMTPEELKFAKKLQDKEDSNNGKLDKNDDQELYFMIAKLLKRQRGLREEESLEKPKQQGTDSKTMNEYNKKKIKEMMNTIITRVKQELAEAEKPDFLDVDKDGDKEEPMSKAADEKGDDKEGDKDLSKVPAQLRKHVAKKVDESESVEESSCGGDHKREEDELDEGCCGKCGQSDCGCGNKMYEEDEGMEGFLSERRNNLFGKLVNEWFSAEKK